MKNGGIVILWVGFLIFSVVLYFKDNPKIVRKDVELIDKVIYEADNVACYTLKVNNKASHFSCVKLDEEIKE